MRDFGTDFRLLTSPLRLLPDFAIVGEAKCGTTSLYRYLLQHDAVLGADRKEPKNFIDYPDSLLRCRSHYPIRAVKYFRRIRLMRPVVAGEATAEYFSHPRVPERLKEVLPHLRIIVLLRNPVHRAYSDYQMLSRQGVIALSFEEVVERSVEWLGTPSLHDLVDAALEKEHFYLRFVARGIYLRSLRRWFGIFPPAQIQVLKSEDLFDRTQPVLAQACRFLGLEPFEPADTQARRKGDYTVCLAERMKRRLSDFYRPHNKELYAFMNRNMRWEQELGVQAE